MREKDKDNTPKRQIGMTCNWRYTFSHFSCAWITLHVSILPKIFTFKKLHLAYLRKQLEAYELNLHHNADIYLYPVTKYT